MIMIFLQKSGEPDSGEKLQTVELKKLLQAKAEANSKLEAENDQLKQKIMVLALSNF